MNYNNEVHTHVHWQLKLVQQNWILLLRKPTCTCTCRLACSEVGVHLHSSRHKYTVYCVAVCKLCAMKSHHLVTCQSIDANCTAIATLQSITVLSPSKTTNHNNVCCALLFDSGRHTQNNSYSKSEAVVTITTAVCLCLKESFVNLIATSLCLLTFEFISLIRVTF